MLKPSVVVNCKLSIATKKVPMESNSHTTFVRHPLREPSPGNDSSHLCKISMMTLFEGSSFDFGLSTGGSAICNLISVVVIEGHWLCGEIYAII